MLITATPISSPEHRRLIEVLYPLYIHDLSEFTDEFRLDATGRWQPDFLSTWLEGSPQAHALLLRADGAPVGFAFVGQAPFPYMTPGFDFRMSEFFILRAWRRRGIGRLAAFAVFDRFKGRWEVSQLARNTAAIRFWTAAIGEYTQGAYLEQEVDGGPGQVFTLR